MNDSGEGKVVAVRLDGDEQVAVRDPAGVMMPALVVAWDERTQTPVLKFDPRAFRNWEFVAAVLTLASDGAKGMARVQQAIKAQQAQLQSQAEERIARSIIRGK